ncbi:MAG: molybdopterin-dependent oxidoreductase, partial [Gammaproteobacteria bacterium]|nr:molybdopterin-dependent oxidoreductase [Gammaproteobacteria bacterium]
MRRLIHPHRFTSNTTSAHDAAPLHVSGTADFIDDLNPAANLLHLYVGGASQIGEIQSIDLDAVRQSPGVVAVFTAKDIPGHKDIGPVFPGDVLLAESSIDYVGQPVFLVAANQRDDARRAARKADIKIQPCQNITLTPTERVVRPAHTQTLGDVGTALDHAPHQLRGQLEIGGQEHFYLEGQAAQAQLDEDGRFFVQSSSQHPSEVQKLIAEVLDLPMADVVVQTRRMGGGFG